MNTTQSIIVYRNPMEQQMWESGAMFPVMSGCAVGFAVFLAVYSGLTRLYRWRYGYNGRINNEAITYAAGAIALVSGIATIGTML